MNRTYEKMDDLITEISMGPFGSDIKVEYFVDEGVPVLNGSNISGFKVTDDFHNYVTEERASGYRKAIAVRGDIVITHRGTLGQIAYVPDDSQYEKYVISQSQFKVRLNTEKVNPVYFTYYFHTNEGQQRLLSFKSHVGVPALAQATTNFRLLDFPLIPKPKQDAIASILETLDEKIELNNQINAELEAVAKTLYDYWFVQFDFSDANGKPYKSSGGKMVYNEVLKRDIPEGWNNGIIQELIDKVPSSNRVPAKEFKDTGEYPIIDQSQDFICGYTDDKSTVIKPETAHVIFGDHTRVVKLVNFNYARGADGTQVLIAKSDKVPSYLLYQIVSDIDLSNYGYARHYKFLKDTKCVIPNRLVAQRFQEKVKPFHEKIKDNIFQNQQLENLRDWLLPMLMNGQVTVK
jgi:type I restriction enzyme S subunit